MNIDFTGKTILITGSSRGIGKRLAMDFAESGAALIIHYNKNSAAAEETLNALPGNNHRMVSLNLNDPDKMEDFVKEITTQINIDILINNAGIIEEINPARCSFAEWKETWDKTLTINLSSSAHLSFLIGQHMIKNGGGKIINISSRGAFRGEPGAPAYGASKAGMNAMGQSMAKALAPHNVFIYTVAPGFVETDMSKPMLEGPGGDAIKAQSPLNRVATPEEVSRAALLLASEGTDFMTGCILDVNGASYLRS